MENQDQQASLDLREILVSQDTKVKQGVQDYPASQVQKGHRVCLVRLAQRANKACQEIQETEDKREKRVIME